MSNLHEDEIFISIDELKSYYEIDFRKKVITFDDTEIDGIHYGNIIEQRRANLIARPLLPRLHKGTRFKNQDCVSGTPVSSGSATTSPESERSSSQYSEPERTPSKLATPRSLEAASRLAR